MSGLHHETSECHHNGRRVRQGNREESLPYEGWPRQCSREDAVSTGHRDDMEGIR